MRLTFSLIAVGALLIATAFAAQVDSRSTAKRSPPNPDDPRDLFAILMVPSIAEEMNVDLSVLQKVIREESGELSKQIKQLTGPGVTTEDRTAYIKQFAEQSKSKREEQLKEILTPDALIKLRQSAFRLEVLGLGFENAIAHGWLSDEIALTEGQRRSILPKLREIDAETKRQIEDIHAAAERKVFSLLSQEQQRRFVMALGSRLPTDLRHPSQVFGVASARENPNSKR